MCAGSGEEAARYEYDAWGAVRVVLDADVSNVLGLALGSVRVGSINPIRWKCQYFDTTTGLYLVDGSSGGSRWYSPAVRQHVSACAPESALGSAGVIYGLNAHALCLTNPVGLVYDGYTVLPNGDLAFDPPEMTRWQRFWDSNGGRALGAGLLVGALVFVVFVPVAAPFLKGLKTALVMSLGMTGMVLLGNGVQSGMRSAARGGCAWAGFASFVTDNWARSVVVGVVLALTVFGAKKAVVAVKGAGAKVPVASSVQAPEPMVKKVPNPGGRHGGLAHRNKIDFVKTGLREKEWAVRPSEFRTPTPFGKKPFRYIDVVATKGDETIYINVGKMTKAGKPIAREAAVIADLATEDIHLFFVPWR